jgi:AsmA protein
MNKFLKWMLAIVGIVAVLFVIAAIVLPMLIDPNNYKDDIRAAVLEKTGRELTIGGEIEWTVFPSIGFDLYDLELSNREGFGDQPMLNIGAAGTSLKLIPLFSRKIEIGTIRLRDVSAYLHQKANGQNNWEDFSGPASGSQDESPGDDGDFGEIVVSGVEISNANVTWNDAGQITELTNFGLNASNIALGRPVDLEGGFSVNLAQSQMSGDVEFSGIVHSEANAAAYGIEGLKISFEGKQGPAGESIPLDLQINANADIDFNEDKATLSDFGLTFHDLAVNGELNVTSLVETPRFEGQLKVTEFSPKSLLKSLGMSAPDTADASALTSLQADMNFAGTSSLANMRNLNLKFDKSTFNGNFKIENFDRPRLAFDFRIDSLNLDDYLPAPGTETGTKSGAESAETDLTVEDFRGFTGGGDFRIEELIVAGLTITDVSLKMNSNGKGINFSPISSKAYGGLHKGDINIDASGNRPILTTSQQMNGIQVEGLLQDLAGSARLQGSGDIKLNIRTDLTNSQTSRQALSGDMAISFVDGAIVGINVAETIPGNIFQR